jgi:hypothetical protein
MLKLVVLVNFLDLLPINDVLARITPNQFPFFFLQGINFLDCLPIVYSQESRLIPRISGISNLRDILIDVVNFVCQ